MSHHYGPPDPHDAILLLVLFVVLYGLIFGVLALAALADYL